MIINLHFIYLQGAAGSSRMDCIADDRVFQKEKKSNEQWLSSEERETAEPFAEFVLKKEDKHKG